ncbi:MAG: DUF2799 domain-containing protein [Methylococcaceae bacterium]|nr:DUF2799 domain-containing protein [Methylococcaceae bacterium]
MQREWFELGLRDGTNGRAFNRIREHLKACSEYGIQIDREQYSAGREKGLQTYCQLDNAVKTGLEGDLYQSVCPSEIHTPFLRYNQDAYYVYSSKKKLEDLESKLEDKDRCMLDDKLTDDERLKIQDDIQDLESQRERVIDEIDSRENRLEDLIENGY